MLLPPHPHPCAFLRVVCSPSVPALLRNLSTPALVLPALQTEELLTKRRNLLEKKIAHELERAKELTRQGNKRGELQPG